MHLQMPFLLLALLEFCICVAAVFVAAYVSVDGSYLAQDAGIQSSVATAMLFGLVVPVTIMVMGLYQSRIRGGVLGVFLRSVIGFACGVVILAVLYYFFPTLQLQRGVFGLAVLIAFLLIGTIRPMYFHYLDRDILKVRVLVLGAGEKAASIARRLRRHVDRRGFHIVSYAALSTDPVVAVDRKSVVNTAGRSLLELAVASDVDEIVVAADERRGGLPLDELLECKLHGLDVIDLLSFFEREQGKLPLELLRPEWLIYSDRFGRGTFRDIGKRAFDLLASGLILACGWPVLLLTALAIWLEDGPDAPLLCRQVRVGFLGKPFEVLRFRSMPVDSTSGGQARWRTEMDHGRSRVGKFIRKTRIDTLPQILNVLTGTMSLVGPRPESPQFVERLGEAIPYYRERHAVKPGMTGWAQVCYPYDASFNDSVQTQEFDLFYVKNHTIFLDLLILFQAAEVVLFGRGSR
ncbi:MAG: TIGR03013 family PEP-CTERM/XrtA system glycosyltransferase [Granulosicoccus sp.]|nr:TIGR03013 family PEP-CTERM/XrtA system glycosyltransferase [Granulosicoccus sp.]